jgi:hypothetical protein
MNEEHVYISRKSWRVNRLFKESRRALDSTSPVQEIQIQNWRQFVTPSWEISTFHSKRAIFDLFLWSSGLRWEHLIHIQAKHSYLLFCYFSWHFLFSFPGSCWLWDFKRSDGICMVWSSNGSDSNSGQFEEIDQEMIDFHFKNFLRLPHDPAANITRVELEIQMACEWSRFNWWATDPYSRSAADENLTRMKIPWVDLRALYRLQNSIARWSRLTLGWKFASTGNP